jgi:hypothetical protein
MAPGSGGMGADPRCSGGPKGHGRLELRELRREKRAELGSYLEAEDGGPGLKHCGWIRRCRCGRSRRDRPEAWEGQSLPLHRTRRRGN